MTISQTLVDKAHDLATIFAQRAGLEDERRAPLDETVRDMIDSGILATLAPAIYGGHEQDFATAARIIQILSAANPSAGWVAAFYIGAAWRMNLFPEEAQREIFADKPFVLSAGQAAPLREVVRVPGGYRISGQTPWGSGSVHAEWIVFMGIAKGGDEEPAPMTFVVPRAETEVLDTWHIAGMRGTGSNDIKVEDVFVPHHRTAPFLNVLEGTTAGQAVHANPMYQFPFIPFLMVEVIPVVTGIMRGATTAFEERVRERQGTISGAKAVAKQATQMRLGRALATADAAETLLVDLMGALKPHPGQRDRLYRNAMKMKGAYITDLCRNGVNDIAKGIGGDGFRDHSPLQRYFRDINVLAVHAFLDIDTAAETTGCLHLGLPTDDPLI
ncbi:MAG: acyl-CoA dehydrogenase family protein [Novosphingobium sp.]